MNESTTTAPEGTVSSVPVPVVLTPKPVRTRAEQDTRIENDITETARFLAGVKASPALLAFAHSKGFDTARLTEGTTLIAAAQHAYTVRQTALGQMHAAAEALPKAYEAAYSAALEFRETVRINITDHAGQQALAVTGNIPRDTDNFLTRTRAGIEAARSAPYAAILAKAGYNAAGLAALESILDAYAAARTLYTTAVGHATDTTKARDDAYTALRTFSVPFNRLLRLAAKKGIR